MQSLRRVLIFNVSLGFQDNLPVASTTSPQPRLLGSLRAMLLKHFSGGVGMETLRFHNVREDDPSVTGPNYVDVPADSLPELEGANMWWKVPPPSGEFILSGSRMKSAASNKTVVNFSVSALAPEIEKVDDTAGRSSSGSEPPIRQVDSNMKAVSRNARGSGSKASTILPHVGNAGAVRRTKRKRYAARHEQEEKAPPSKKKRNARPTKFVYSDDEDEMEAGPSTGSNLKGKGKAEALGPAEEPAGPEALQVCDESCEPIGFERIIHHTS